MSMDQYKQDNYNYSIAFLKVFFSFCVVLAHYWVTGTDSLFINPVIRLISVAAPMFFVVSFFLTSDKLRDSDVKGLGKRLWRLYFPFIAWAFLYFGGYLILGYFFSVTRLPNEFVIRFTKKDLFWQLLAGSDRHLCPQLWFQFDLIIITTIFWCIFKLSKKYGLMMLSLLGITCIVLQYTQVNYNLFCKFEYELWFPLGRLAESIPFAVAGSLISRKYFVSKIQKHKLPAILVSIIILIIGNLSIVPTPEFGFEYSGIDMLIYTASLFTIVYLLPLGKIAESVKKVLRFLAKYSFGVFCIHLGIGRCWELIICYNLNWKTGTFAECLLIFAISILISWGIGKIPNKYAKMLVT